MAEDSQAEDHVQPAQGGEALVGRSIGGKYRIESVLGRGGMGTIYVAEQQPLGRKVALKVLHPNLGGAGHEDPEFAKRFLLEAATLSQLAHPNIVVVHDYGSLEEDAASCFMVMELVDGQTINDVLRQGHFDPLRALRITREIARALRAAHNLGVVHRDLKPSNVMLCAGPEGESVKVLDFGLVKVVRDDSEELTAEGRFLGSPRYMSPEQIQRLPMDGRSDLYSLGVILYRMLCGAVPFAGDQAVQTLMAHLTKPVPSIAEKTGVQVPFVVERIALRLLEKNPADRYADATELIRAIDEVWSQLSDAPVLTSGEHPRPAELGASAELTPVSMSMPRLVNVPASLPEDAATTQVAAPAPARRPGWMLPMIVVVGAAVGIGGAAGVVSLLDEEPAPETTPARPEAPDPTPPVQADPPPPDPPPVVPDEAPPPAPRTFTLTVRSIPSGATLVRDGVELGETPFSVELDRDALSARPASFTLRMRGRETISFEQGPSDGDVAIERVLPRVATRRPPPGGTPPDEGPRGGDLSIKTQR